MKRTVRPGLPLALVLAAFGACNPAADDGPSSAGSATGERGDGAALVSVFADVTKRAGITWRHDKATSPDKHLPETMSGGGGFLDFDGDGDLDIYLVQCAYSPGPAGAGDGDRSGNVLLRRKDDGTYTDVTKEAGVGDTGFGMGCQAGDIDNDGDQDLFVTNFGANVLYRNQGDGTFADVTEEAGVAGGNRLSTSCAFFDGDADGWLDLYVVNYIQYDPATAQACWLSDGSTRAYCNPMLFDGEDDTLYRNQEGKGFVDVSQPAGILGFHGKGLGVTVFDYDEDGDADVLVANDTTPNLMFRNDGNLIFSEVGLFTGVARSSEGVARAGMGIDIGDLDLDGAIDVFVTNFSGEENGYFRGTGDASFEDLSHEAGLGAPSYRFLGFGTCLSDLELDGDLDILIANGHVNDAVERDNKGETYRQRPLVFQNGGGGTFAEVGERCGEPLREPYAGRALAAGDMDNDGDQDFLLVQVGERPVLLRNDTPRQGASVLVVLIGTASNRDGIGAIVEAAVNSRTIKHQATASRSYLSTHDRRVLLGLGKATSIDKLTVRWPSGQVDEASALPVDVLLTIEEGKGVISQRPLEPRS